MPEIEEKIAEILCNKIDGKEKIRGSSYEELKRTIEDSEYDGCFSLKHCNSTVNYYREKAIELLASEIEPSVTLKDIIEFYYENRIKKIGVCNDCNKDIFNADHYYQAIISSKEEIKVLFSCNDCYLKNNQRKQNAT